MLLARLDQMFFEGSINEDEADTRDHLFKVLNRETPSERTLREILNMETAQGVLDITGDKEEPWKGRANRLLKSRPGGISLLQKYGDEGAWSSFETSLKNSMGSEGAIHS
jgi:hypothetical protein